jgi:hypothetical protein
MAISRALSPDGSPEHHFGGDNRLSTGLSRSLREFLRSTPGSHLSDWAAFPFIGDWE